MFSLVAIPDFKGFIGSKEFLQTFLLFAVVFLSAKFALERFSQRNQGSRKGRRWEELVDTFPGPRKYPVVNNLYEFYRIFWNPNRDFMDWLVSKKERYGPIFRIWKANRPMIVVACAETAFELYKNDHLMDKSSEVTKSARKVNGMGLLAVDAHTHSTRRKMWNPNFRRKQVEYSVKFFRKEGVKLRDYLEQFAGDGAGKERKVIDMLELTVGTTFRAICYSAFGEEYMDQLPESAGKEHMHDLHTIAVNATARIFRPWLYNDYFFFNLTPGGRETKRAVDRGTSLTQEALIERRKQRTEMGWKNEISPNNNFRGDSETESWSSFLDHLLDLHDSGYLTEKDVIQELNVFIVAGYDTSGITVSFVLYFLALYPEHQDRVAEELYQIFNSTAESDSSKNYQVTASDTKNMKYLELCIKETLRLYPVLPLSPRRTTHDVALPDGKIIPAGVDVLVDLGQIQRDPKYFPEPDLFRPERHNESNSTAFMPFTLGSRNCIGQVYAMFEMKVILSYLLMTYKWETEEEPNMKPVFQTLQVPENGIRFKITKRMHPPVEE